MKSNTIIFIVLCLLFLQISSCNEEYYNSESVINCNNSSHLHPNNGKYQDWLDDFAKKGIVGLTVLIDKQGEDIWMGSAGYANIEQNIKMTPCHLHHTASIYKTYISVIILQLADEGRISLEDKISLFVSPDIIKELPGGNLITIKNLLEHRSGLPDIFEIDFLLDFFNNPKRKYSNLDLLQYIFAKTAKSKPGEDFYYSDANYALLSVIISEVEGSVIQSFNNRIKFPLKLTDTYFLESGSPAPAGLTSSYWDRHGNGKVENISDYQITLTRDLEGIDGIVTTANDMNIFLKSLVNGTLVSQASLEQMTKWNDVPEFAQTNYGIKGYGMGIMHVNVGGYNWYGHTGNHIGSGAVALYCPEKQTTLVIFQNIGTYFSEYTKRYIFSEIIKDVESF